MGSRRKIEGFRQLPPGWCYGEGVRFESATISLALDIDRLCCCLGLGESDAFPGLEGEILYALYRGERCIEFTVRPDGLIDCQQEFRGEEEESEEGLSAIAAKEKIKKLCSK